MSEIAYATAAFKSPVKQTEKSHPHYFNTFQNYCYGSKNQKELCANNREFAPIPDQFQAEAELMLRYFHQQLMERSLNIIMYTSVLPREIFVQNFDIDIQRYLIDTTILKTLNDGRIINWMSQLKKLYPVRTSGNGNCLLHAILISMAGIHDFNLHLRDRLLQFMDQNKETLKSSWKTEKLRTDKIYGIQTEESELNREWDDLCNLVRYEHSHDGQKTSNLQFLEGVHIFSISNMLGRPIIVLSEEVVRNKHGEAISYNDLFGIYFPTIRKEKEIVKIPIVLAYDQSHFCPLQTTDEELEQKALNLIPLYQSIEQMQKNKLLPIRFLGNNTDEKQQLKFLKNYLNIKSVNHSSMPVLCAELGTKTIVDEHNFFLLYYKYISTHFTMLKAKLVYDENYFSNNPSYSDALTLVNAPQYSTQPPAYATVTSNGNNNTFQVERSSSYKRAVTEGSIANGQIQPSNFSNWEQTQDELVADDKAKNATNSKLRQMQLKPSGPQIPILYERIDSNRNLIDFDQSLNTFRQCNLCKRRLDTVLSSGLCIDCDNKTKMNFSNYVNTGISQQNVRYISDFISPWQSSPVTTRSFTTYCGRCCTNQLHVAQDRQTYFCIICGNTFRPMHH